MKNLTLLFAAMSLSLAVSARDWTYNRLNRLYHEDPSRCLEVSKRIIKRSPDKPSPYYFASAFYKERQKKFTRLNSRYMIMSKALRYAAQFEETGDLNLMSRLNWSLFVKEIRVEADALILDLDSNEMTHFADLIRKKSEHLLFLHNRTIIIEDGQHDGFSEPNSNDNDIAAEENNTPTPSGKEGYFGLASGHEIASSANKIQEQKLLDLINKEREALFMKPLKWDESLARAARYHATDMAGQDYAMNDSYDRINGQLEFVATASERISQFQTRNNVYQQEIAIGNMSAETTLLQWISKDETYDKLFSESNRAVGIGLAHDPNTENGYYWVIVLAEKR